MKPEIGQSVLVRENAKKITEPLLGWSKEMNSLLNKTGVIKNIGNLGIKLGKLITVTFRLKQEDGKYKEIDYNFVAESLYLAKTPASVTIKAHDKLKSSHSRLINWHNAGAQGTADYRLEKETKYEDEFLQKAWKTGWKEAKELDELKRSLSLIFKLFREEKLTATLLRKIEKRKWDELSDIEK